MGEVDALNAAVSVLENSFNGADLTAYYSHPWVAHKSFREGEYLELFRLMGAHVINPLDYDDKKQIPHLIEQSDLVFASTIAGYVTQGMAKDFRLSLSLKKPVFLVNLPLHFSWITNKIIVKSVIYTEFGHINWPLPANFWLLSHNGNQEIMGEGIIGERNIGVGVAGKGKKGEGAAQRLRLVDEADPLFRYCRLDLEGAPEADFLEIFEVFCRRGVYVLPLDQYIGLEGSNETGT